MSSAEAREPLQGLGAVVIGRNEGERLRRCLLSLSGVSPLVYVDSGSTDGSVDLARELGASVVELDPGRPFTAARARNEGLARLREVEPELECVQLVDGDCEVVPGWLQQALARLRARPRLAAVAGRLRERHPEASVYNRLCDMEWDTPPGEADYVGGIAAFRLEALSEVAGFREELIAGEEPELCVRLRQRGWSLERLDHDMALHDAAMTSFSQWWRRAVRGGHAFAEGAWLHGDSPQRHWVDESRRIVRWGLVVPGLAFGCALPTLGGSLLLLGGYPVSAYRAYRQQLERGRPRGDAALYGAFCTLGKFPELQGLIRFHRSRLLGRRSGLIEHKGGS